jgi:hypothetical protein
LGIHSEANVLAFLGSFGYEVYTVPKEVADLAVRSRGLLAATARAEPWRSQYLEQMNVPAQLSSRLCSSR